jgi:uncharacterized membrane protein YdjX (TVP38/TMEM64 family)
VPVEVKPPADPAGAPGELLGRTRNHRRRFVLGAVLLAAVLVAANALHVDQKIPGVLEAARGLGVRGVLLFVAVYVVGALLALPVAPVTIAAGATYGTLLGAALGVPSVTLAGACTFLVGRFLATHPHAFAVGQGRVAKAVRAIGRGGLRLVLVLRLAPVVPFALLNYAFGMTPTTLREFALGTFVGTIPSQLAYAFLGAIVTWPAGPARTVAQVGLVTASVVASVAATAGALRILRRGQA